MKFFTVFAGILSVAFAAQGGWTLDELSAALQNPSTDPNLVPYLENALNEIMSALHAGQQVETVSVTIPAVDLSTWTLDELSEALQDPSTDPTVVPYLEQALNALMDAIVAGTPAEVAPVVIPAMDVSSWTLSELTEALDNPSTNPELVPYLEHALNEMMSALFSGQQIEAIAIAIPVDLLEVSPAMPIPLAESSPLVQIIVNVNQQAVSPDVVDQTPILPEHVTILDESAVVENDPVQVIGTPIIPVPAVVLPEILN